MNFIFSARHGDYSLEYGQEHDNEELTPGGISQIEYLASEIQKYAIGKRIGVLFTEADRVVQSAEITKRILAAERFQLIPEGDYGLVKIYPVMADLDTLVYFSHECPAMNNPYNFAKSQKWKLKKHCHPLSKSYPLLRYAEAIVVDFKKKSICGVIKQRRIEEELTIPDIRKFSNIEKDVMDAGDEVPF